MRESFPSNNPAKKESVFVPDEAAIKIKKLMDEYEKLVALEKEYAAARSKTEPLGTFTLTAKDFKEVQETLAPKPLLSPEEVAARIEEIVREVTELASVPEKSSFEQKEPKSPISLDDAENAIE